MRDSSSSPRLRVSCMASLGIATSLALLVGAHPSSGADPAMGASPGSVPSASRAALTEPAARFPYDPVCAWGRVSDGRGLIVRCLDQGEAQRLVSPASIAPTPAPAGAPGGTPVSSSAAVPAAKSPATATAAPSKRVVVTEVGAARADTGELPEAAPQLRRAVDRYVRCVEENGGLEGASGLVTVRFLVRERGRAEGVAVKERRGVSVAAAKCIADVVDRRYVGYPAAPIVGATLSIALGAEGTAR